MSDDLDYLIVGLGNPGSRYRNTWHNIGALTVEELARRWEIELKPGKGDFFIGGRKNGDTKTTLMIPTSYMNRSGSPVAGWVRYYNIALENIIVIYDDHDLPFGKIRLRTSGSSGGHRGLESIILRLNNDQIPRLRIGIRLGNEYPDLARQVLSKIPASLEADVVKVTDTTADAVEEVLNNGFLVTMNYYNGIEIL